MDRQPNDRLGRTGRFRQQFKHRRQILRAICFANAYANCNSNCDGNTNTHADGDGDRKTYAGSAGSPYPSAPAVKNAD